MGRGGGDGEGAKLEGSQRNSTPASGGAALRLVEGRSGFSVSRSFLSHTRAPLTLRLYVAHTDQSHSSQISSGW